MSAANASHPFSIPFFLPFFLPTAYVYVCPADYRKEDMRLFVSYTRRRRIGVRGSRLSTRFPHHSAFLFFFSSLPSPYLVSLLTTTQQTSPTPRASCTNTRGRKGSCTPDSRNFASSRPFDRTVVLPLSFLFWNL